MHMDAKVMPTDDTDCSCHIKPLNLFNQSRRVYITPLVINSLEGGHTHTHTHTHTHKHTHTNTHTHTHKHTHTHTHTHTQSTHVYRHLRTEGIIRNQACAWFKNNAYKPSQIATNY